MGWSGQAGRIGCVGLAEDSLAEDDTGARRNGQVQCSTGWWDWHDLVCGLMHGRHKSLRGQVRVGKGEHCFFAHGASMGRSIVCVGPDDMWWVSASALQLYCLRACLCLKGNSNSGNSTAGTQTAGTLTAGTQTAGIQQRETSKILAGESSPSSVNSL